MAKHIPIILLLIIILLNTPTYSSQPPPQQPPSQSQPPTKCQQQCNQNPSCLLQCQDQKQQYSKNVLIISVSILLFCVLSCTCCMVSSHVKFRRFRLFFNTKYQAVKKKYNKINQNIMNKEEFAEYVEFITELINSSDTKQNFITSIDSPYKQPSKINQTPSIHTKSCTKNSQRLQIVGTQQIQSFLQKIQIEGQDNQGSWSASGYIVCTGNGVIVWFLKEYDDVGYYRYSSTSKHPRINKQDARYNNNKVEQIKLQDNYQTASKYLHNPPSQKKHTITNKIYNKYIYKSNPIVLNTDISGSWYNLLHIHNQLFMQKNCWRLNVKGEDGDCDNGRHQESNNQFVEGQGR